MDTPRKPPSGFLAGEIPGKRAFSGMDFGARRIDVQEAHMFFYHDSRNRYTREPFGAVRAGTKITLRAVCAEPVTLRLWDGQEHLVPMQKTGTVCAGQIPGYGQSLQEARLTAEPDETPLDVYEAVLDETYTGSAGLLWYYFVTRSGARFAAMDPLGGPCVRHSDGAPLHSQQITVYEKDFETPDWMHRAVVYQLFPDRFYDALDGARLKRKRRAGPDIVVHRDKREMPFVTPNGDGPDGIENNDFYGGNITGIRSKLAQLCALGVTAIYLNPIFEAASNHRYDTANYERVDRMLGSNEDFIALCREARRKGVRIILDGAFSHTGADSVYFNKFGHYDSVGAYQSESSPYASWYRFERFPDKYETWWGIQSLPCVNEMDPGYLDYMVTGPCAIVAKWLRAGASGWRLDVADELPDAFIRLLRQRVKSEKPDAAIIGEVWEDATTKISYGQHRTYALGHGLDSVMNYPLRDALIAFLLGQGDSLDLMRTLRAQQEHYPLPMYYALMNLMGTHDRSRILNILGQCDDQSLTRQQQRQVRMTEQQRMLGKKRLVRMLQILCALPGMPSVYYGDEAGMEGMRDPLCRGYYPWGNQDAALMEAFQHELSLRRTQPIRTDGFVSFFCPDPDTIQICRFYQDGKNAFGEPAAGSDLVVTVSRTLDDSDIL